jgi:hypothetical protein
MSSRSQDELHGVASSDASADERTLYDPESDDDGRPSGELMEGDHNILESEDERDRLLTQEKGMFGKNRVKIGKLSQKADVKEKSKSKSRRGQNEETSALMYEMEEGIGHNSSTSLRSRRSSDSDEQRLTASRALRKARTSSVGMK